MSCNLYLVLFFFLCSVAVFSQESVNTTGGKMTNTTGEINYSIGQVFYDNSSPNRSTSVGIQFSPLVVFNNLEIRIYPNPSINNISVKLDGADYSKYVIVNMSGQNILKGNLNKEPTPIDVSELTMGNYLLYLMGQNSTKILKFIKKDN